jgi:type II secretory pathway component GspD/PulD (secretin)
MQFSSSLAIEKDEPSEILQVKSIVNKLDILLDQVKIEIVNAQVTLTKRQMNGIDTFNIGFTL